MGRFHQTNQHHTPSQWLAVLLKRPPKEGLRRPPRGPDLDLPRGPRRLLPPRGGRGRPRKPPSSARNGKSGRAPAKGPLVASPRATSANPNPARSFPRNNLTSPAKG